MSPLVRCHSPDGHLPGVRMGKSASESVERLPLEKALLACEGTRGRQTQDAPLGCVPSDKLVCRSPVLDPDGIEISPIVSATHVPAGGSVVAPARRSHRRLQPADRTMVRKRVAFSGAASVGLGRPVVLVAMGWTGGTPSGPLPRDVAGANAGMDGCEA